jgi:O-antigen/teichoic acid export membrane protein
MGRMLSTQITIVVWPELTALDALADNTRLDRAFRTTSKLAGFIVGLGLLGFLPVAEPLYAAWTLKKLTLDPVTLGMLIAQSVLWGFWGVGSTALLATNRQGRLALLLAANAAVVFVLSVFLVPRVGIRGCAAASLLADVTVASWLVPRAACKALGDSFKGYAREILSSLGVGLLVPAAISAGLYFLLPAGLFRALVIPPVFALIALPLFSLTLADEERQTATRLVAKVRQKLFGSRGAPL